MNFIAQLLVILMFALICGSISAKLNLPLVLGELLAGLIIGPAFLNLVSTNDFLEVCSELGVVILMFLAGLESKLSSLKKVLKPSVLVAVIGLVIPIIVAGVTGLVFGFSKPASIFLGVTFAATSVSISVEVLKELNKLQSKEGATILGAAVVDDVLAVITLSFISNFGGQPFRITLLKQVGGLTLILAVSWLIVPLVIDFSAKLPMPNAKSLMALIICFGMSYLAEISGLSAVIGSFFAGLAIGQTKYKKAIFEPINFSGELIFIPIFFASIGLKMNIKELFANFGLFIALTLGGIFSKLLGAGLGAKIAGFNWSSALMVGAGMVSRGEMALIIAKLGLKNHLFSIDSYSAIVGAIIVTTIIAPLILKRTA
ncbi:cation:proton antiporter [Xylocopilactobacillus apicola]|uniref:Sodium:proton antiporter n=1 Tax=Xylocopilactobacillus apicola TaxID=2932184 RepID=A0AAU9D8N5_9LACO|nr:cation:proton antiporter [Xylocopilactobacillus apicola]BDR58751.1 sodium:proton antiporter [Xylocopilactobacillus apicola]